MMDYQAVIERVKELAAPMLEEAGIELVDLTFRYESGGLVLRLLVDREGGINAGECAGVNQRLSLLLDETNVIEKRYILEVSSPGLDRPLVTKRDFGRAMGEAVKITTFVPVADKTAIEGYVRDVTDDAVKIESKDGMEIIIPLDRIRRAVREIKF